MEAGADQSMALASTSKVVLGCLSFLVFWVMAVFPKLPFLPIGRTAGSLLGAVLMVVSQLLSPSDAFKAVDLSILGLLFGTMVLGVYLERADLFKYLCVILSWKKRGPKDLLCRVCVLSAISSALFTNDTTCVVFTPFILKLCKENNLPTGLFLIALATSSNIGSSATPIGNPQNLVIAVNSKISFGTFLIGVLPAMILGIIINIFLLMCYWKCITAGSKKNSLENGTVSDITDMATGSICEPPLPGSSVECIESQCSSNGKGVIMSFKGQLLESGNNMDKVTIHDSKDMVKDMAILNADKLQNSSGVHKDVRHSIVDISDLLGLETRGSFSGQRSFCLLDRPLSPCRVAIDASVVTVVTCGKIVRKFQKVAVYVVAVGMLAAFLYGLDLAWTALTAAVALMAIGFTDAGPSLDQVSYSLLVFFSGMFIAVEGFNKTGVPGLSWGWVKNYVATDSVGGIAVLSVVVAALSNIVSNVPTVLLLGMRVAAIAKGSDVTKAWLILAWVSTVAGNLTMFGSAANLIVSEQAKRSKDNSHNFSILSHLRFGVVSTLVIIPAGLPLITK